MLSLLADKPVLILVPGTLVWQWQTELQDMLGLPSCVWSTPRKCWIDHQGFPISGRSFVYAVGERRHADREAIKQAVQRGAIRLLVATDAACEGLNLQRLGAQINVDLPWNPSRLEQRKGRIQRIGQRRAT